MADEASSWLFLCQSTFIQTRPQQRRLNRKQQRGQQKWGEALSLISTNTWVFRKQAGKSRRNLERVLWLNTQYCVTCEKCPQYLVCNIVVQWEVVNVQAATISGNITEEKQWLHSKYPLCRCFKWKKCIQADLRPSLFKLEMKVTFVGLKWIKWMNILLHARYIYSPAGDKIKHHIPASVMKMGTEHLVRGADSGSIDYWLYRQACIVQYGLYAFLLCILFIPGLKSHSCGCAWAIFHPSRPIFVIAGVIESTSNLTV